MASYLVKAPCAYVNADGSAIAHSAAAVDVTVIELSDDIAAELGAAVHPLAAAPDTANPTPFPDAKVSVDGVDQGPGRRGKRTPDPGEASDG